MYFDLFNEERLNYRSLYVSYLEFTVYGILLNDYIYNFLNE